MFDELVDCFPGNFGVFEKICKERNHYLKMVRNGILLGLAFDVFFGLFLYEQSPEIMDKFLERISVDPNACFGKPCIKGTRIWVALILDFLAAGNTFEEILEAYPYLSQEDILACIGYGAAMSREHFVNINMATA